MRHQKIDNLNISESEKKAVRKICLLVQKQWFEPEFVIFGSKATETSTDSESDLDLLILLPCKVTQQIKRKIIHIVFEVNIEYEVNVSPLIVGKEDWQSRLSVLPLHYFVEKEGVAI